MKCATKRNRHFRSLAPIPALLGAMFILGGCNAAPRGPVIFAGDFDDGRIFERRFRTDINGDGLITLVQDPGDRVGLAAMFSLNDRSRRTELELRRRDDPIGSERWYGFRVFIPNDWQPNDRDELVVQWRSRHDKPLGEVSRSPVLGLRVEAEHWRISTRWDSNRITPKNDYEGKETVWIGPFARGVWTDWVFHVHWSYREDGLIEVWKDGVHIARRRGPNCFNDRKGIFVKFGLYHTDAERVIYHDSWRIGNERARYEDVAPGNSTAEARRSGDEEDG